MAKYESSLGEFHCLEGLHRPFNVPLKQLVWVCTFIKTIWKNQRLDCKLSDVSYLFFKHHVCELHKRYKDGEQELEGLIQPKNIERIYGAWQRLKKAEEDGKSYDPLKDDELFLRQKDFDLYFLDLARLSKNDEYHDKVPEFPFYAEARKAITDEIEWAVSDIDDCSDKDYEHAMGDFIRQLSPKELDRLVNGVQEPVVNPYKGIGRNDPCPCGSGLKFKKCCGKNL